MGVLLAIQVDGLPPSVNTSYRGKSVKSGRVVFYKKPEVKRWQLETQNELKRAASDNGLILPITDRLRLTIICATKNGRRMDVDNRIKAVQDCLQTAGIIKDDSQIWDVRAIRYMLNDSALCEIEELQGILNKSYSNETCEYTTVVLKKL